MAVFGTIKHAWNAFLNQAPADGFRGTDYGMSYGGRPDRVRNISNERSLIASVYTRIAMDVAGIEVRHVRLDENNRFTEEMDSGLNNCLTLEANIDQAASAFFQDIALTLCQKGVAAVVPVDTTIDPSTSGGFEIKTLRVGEITQWMPRHVRVNLYNESTGRREDLILEKKFVAIIENPFYDVMNEPSSTLQRLVRKLNILDAIDEQSGSGKLDIIIQLPYVIKSEARKQQAEQRRQDIEFQLKGSRYGIAYTDGTEKITQLNRPAENNLLTQVQYLTEKLYSELGLSKKIIDGDADEAAMINYMSRTIEPLVRAIVEEMKRKFLTKTARAQKQSIMYFRDPFKLVPISELAEIADKMTRNEILTSNEFRGIMGFRPSKEPKADQLVNSNIPQAMTGVGEPAAEGEIVEGEVVQNALPAGSDDPELDLLEGEIDEILGELE